jgi:hypothetical protein
MTLARRIFDTCHLTGSFRLRSRTTGTEYSLIRPVPPAMVRSSVAGFGRRRNVARLGSAHGH